MEVLQDGIVARLCAMGVLQDGIVARLCARGFYKTACLQSRPN